MQELLQAKGDECAELTSKLAEIQLEKNEISQRLDEADAELFKLRAQQRDTQYVLGSKDESINELHQKWETTLNEVEHLKDLMAEFETKLAEKESCQLEDEKTASNIVVHLQETLRETRQELANMEAELASRSEAVQKLEKSCASLTKETSERNAEIQRLKEDLQDAEVVLAEKDSKLKVVQVKINVC